MRFCSRALGVPGPYWAQGLHGVAPADAALSRLPSFQHSAGKSNERMNVGARFSKHGRSGRPPALPSPAPVAGSRGTRRSPHVLAGSAAQPGTALTAPTFLALKTGREQDALLFSVRELERDLRAVPGAGGEGTHHAPTPQTQRAASLHPRSVPILSFGGGAQSSPRPLPQPGWLEVLPRANGGDKRLQQRDSLQLETPPALTWLT